MRYLPIAGAALAAALTATSAMAFNADDTSCRKLYSQVNNDLQSNAQASNHDEALKERDLGRDFCNQGHYRVGTDHLTAALKLLGDTPGGNSQAQAS